MIVLVSAKLRQKVETDKFFHVYYGKNEKECKFYTNTGNYDYLCTN